MSSILSTHLTPSVEKMLVKQITIEHTASMTYLAMAIWADTNDYAGAAHYLYRQSNEERSHMLKIITYLTELGKHPELPLSQSIVKEYDSLKDIFSAALQNEIEVTQSLIKITQSALISQDFITFNFMQEFINEQREEERSAKEALALFDLIEGNKKITYWVDRALGKKSKNLLSE